MGRWLSRYQDQWVYVLIAFFVTILFTYTLPDIVASADGARLFKATVDLEAHQIKAECREQVKEAVTKGTRFFSQLSATIAFLLHIFPASALTTIFLLGQIALLSTWRYSVLWREWYGVPLLDAVGFASLACEFAVLATLCIALNSSLRKQFLLNWNTTRTKDERIEQLHGEKERLEYERVIASQKSRQRRAGGDGSEPEPSEYTSRSAPTSTQTPCHHVRLVPERHGGVITSCSGGGGQPCSRASSSNAGTADNDAWPSALPMQLQAGGLDGRVCCPLAHE